MPVERTWRSLEQITDSCFVSYPDGPIQPGLIDDYPALLDAGGQLDIRLNGRPYLTLVRIGFQGGGYGYSAGEFLGNNLPLPEGALTATVPGADFPTFDDAAFPSVPPPVISTGGAPPVMSRDGSFTWEPYAPRDAVALLTFQVAPAEFEGVYVECVAADDGYFAFPAATQAELLQVAPEFEGRIVGADRSVYRAVLKEDTVLVLHMGSGLPAYLLRE